MTIDPASWNNEDTDQITAILEPVINDDETSIRGVEEALVVPDDNAEKVPDYFHTLEAPITDYPRVEVVDAVEVDAVSTLPELPDLTAMFNKSNDDSQILEAVIVDDTDGRFADYDTANTPTSLPVDAPSDDSNIAVVVDEADLSDEHEDIVPEHEDDEQATVRLDNLDEIMSGLTANDTDVEPSEEIADFGNQSVVAEDDRLTEEPPAITDDEPPANTPEPEDRMAVIRRHMGFPEQVDPEEEALRFEAYAQGNGILSDNANWESTFGSFPTHNPHPQYSPSAN